MMPLVLMASLLYGPHTPEAERSKRLATLFDPPPGQLLPIDRISELENSKSPENIKGEIWIRPPKGQCIIVRRDLQKPDQKICKPTPFKWKVDDLDSLGRFRLNVMLFESWDEGTFLTWTSPYRIGNFVAAGDKESGNFEDIIIRRCKAEEIEGDRFVTLEAFDGRRWKISLPAFDTPVREDEPEIPNLVVNIDSQKKPVDPGKKDEAKADAQGEKKTEAQTDKAKTPPETDGKDKSSVLGTLLSGDYKEELKPKLRWNIGFRGAYKMESGRFSETGSPQGMTGQCRYIFKNAPGDASSGAIECYDTDTMDNVYVHVPCFSQLKVREEPKAKTKTKGQGQAKEKGP